MAADSAGSGEDKVVRLTAHAEGEARPAAQGAATASATTGAVAAAAGGRAEPAAPRPPAETDASGPRQPGAMRNPGGGGGAAGPGGGQRARANPGGPGGARRTTLPGMAAPARAPRDDMPVLAANPAQRPPSVRSGRARARARYRAVLASFLLCVLGPVIVVGSYLYLYAADQYHSTASFSIRSEESGSGVSSLLGVIGAVSSTGSASDPDVLFEYIRSQDIVETIDAEIDLKAIFSRATDDPVFALAPGGTIEDLYAKWMQMVDVIHESSNGILTIEARAFAPEDAQLITREIVEKSSILINRLSQVAHQDTLDSATKELEEAKAHLFEVRQRLTVFRRTNQIVDPLADAQGQLGILNALQAELARALIDRDTVASFAQPDDPRLASADIRIEAITNRIAAERASMQRTQDDEGTLDIFSQYENLLVEQEFAQASYTSALATLAEAQAEARRQARFVAVHVEPTLAEQALYPQRIVLTALTALFAVLGWGLLMLAYYNVRDNR